MITLLFLSCVKSEDSFQNATVKLRLEGGIGVTIPDAAADTRAEAIKPTVETLRVLTFNSSGALMGNVLLQGSELGIAADASNHWIITIPTDTFVEASYGDNHVYVVLNESVAGITEQLTAANLTQTQMETIREGKVAYNELIPVTEGEEPPFIMCVYDVVNVSQSQTTLNLTGLDSDDDEPIYGFPMRRTMAKIVLESVYGGVGADGKIIGTDITYNPSSTTDQTGTGDTSNKRLINAGEIFIHKVELINVPKSYSWRQNVNENVTYPSVNGYSAFNMTSELPTQSGSPNFLARNWYGSISASGTVGFTREDHLGGIWLASTNSGTNSYDYGEKYYDITKGGDRSFYEKNLNGQVALNEGNFPPWLAGAYDDMPIIPGEVIPTTPQLNNIEVDPSPWNIDIGRGYYIPENIPANTNDSHTKLRVYYKMADISATIDEDKMMAAIKETIQNGDFDIVQDDGNTVDFSTPEGKAYFYSLGYWRSQQGYVQNDYINGTRPENDWKDGSGNTYKTGTDVIYAGYTWSGLKVVVKGDGITVNGVKNGYYFASLATNETVGYIDVPLYNPTTDGVSDNNVYRGTEYKVKLYVTDKLNPVSQSGNVTYHQLPTMTRSGAEDLCIAAEVVTSTSANQLHDSVNPN